RHRIDQRCRDHIARGSCSLRPIGRHRKRITRVIAHERGPRIGGRRVWVVELRGKLVEVPGSHCGGRHETSEKVLPDSPPRTLVVGEEERLVLLDWTAD